MRNPNELEHICAVMHQDPNSKRHLCLWCNGDKAIQEKARTQKEQDDQAPPRRDGR